MQVTKQGPLMVPSLDEGGGLCVGSATCMIPQQEIAGMILTKRPRI